MNLISWKLWFLPVFLISILITPLSATTLNDFEGREDNSTNSSEVIFESSGGQYEIGDEVCIDITTKDFIDIGSFFFVLNWNTTLLKFSRFDFTDALLSANDVNLTDEFPDYIFSIFVTREGWKTLGDNSKIFTVCFIAKANGNTKILFADDPRGTPSVEVVTKDTSGKYLLLYPSFIEQDIIIGQPSQPCVPDDTLIECGGHSYNLLNAQNWHERNLAKLANCTTGDCENSTVTSDFDYDNLMKNCGFTGFINVNYSIINNCDTLNTIATFTIIDTTNPIISCQPDNRTFECNGLITHQVDANAWNAANIAKLNVCATDLCTNPTDVVVTSDYYFANLTDECGFTGSLTVTYTITDACGNLVTTLATYTIEDTTNPTVACTPSNTTIECLGDIGNKERAAIWDVENILRLETCASDYCGNITVTSDFDYNNINIQCGVTGSIKVTYTIIDECDNLVEMVTHFTVEDTSDPILTCDPTSETHECNGLAGNQFASLAWNENNLTLLRNCSSDECGGVTVTSNYNFANLSDECALTGSMTVTFTILDDCGNSVTKTGTFTVEDTEVPIGSCDPENLTFECVGEAENQQLAEQWNAQNMLILSNCSFDNCTATLGVISNFDVNLLDLSCESESSLIVTYTIADECDNTITKVAIITKEITKTNIPLCEEIQIQSSNNELIFSNLSAPNTITKIFDPNWQIIYNCSGDCPETVTSPDLIAGKIYHTDVQFYDGNWNFICEDKQDVLIEGGGEPCITSICQGDVILQTQAEVDAFCGCEVIEGDLKIGNLETNIISDISTLATLSSIKKVLGNVAINHTILKNISGLDNLEETSVLSIRNCKDLMNLNALEKLKIINFTFDLGNNASLNDITGIRNLRKVQNILLSGCPISNLTVFANLENTTLSNIEITNSQQLLNLDGFQNIIRLENELGSGGITLGGNKALTDISALANLVYMEQLTIADNDALDNCCTIAHLLDEDEANGILIGKPAIFSNGNFCNSSEEILQNCQTPPPTCENIQIITQNNQIIIDGLTAPNEIVKVFDKDYNIVYQCVANCEERQIAGIFPEGNYTVDLQLYDESWGAICAEQRPIILESDDEPCDTSICAGNVVLRTQAEVDAFCGCEVIEGDLLLIGEGVIDGVVGQSSDIFNTEKFTLLKEVRGNLVISNTSINDFTGFKNLQKLGRSLVVQYNQKVNNLIGFEKIDTIEQGLMLFDNPFLENLDDLANLKFFRSLSLSGNFLDIDIIKEIPINKLSNLSLTRCQLLESLDGLVNIDSITSNSGNQYLILGNNNALKDISALSSLKFIGGNLNIQVNPNLATCCPISHLVDDNANNGVVNGQINIENNAQFCNSVEEILQSCQNAIISCENIQINTENNQITLSNIIAPNTIVKVFDPNWQLIYECTATCENEIVVPVESEGIYHTDVQFYDENWAFICEDREDIEVINVDEPCDTSICAGNVILRTQAEVDAFCGCEVIEGDLRIGLLPTDEISPNIKSLNNLKKLKAIKGEFSITRTQLSNLKGLENLSQIGKGLGIINNSNLTNLAGLNGLEEIGLNFSVWNNPVLENLDDLDRLVHINGQFTLINNDKIKSIKGLSNIKVISLISIKENENLSTLDGLESIDSINLIGFGLRGLRIKDNNNLKDITALKNIQLVIGDFIISGNSSLEDCCSIAHLINNEEADGRVVGEITLSDNTNFCNSSVDILQNCQETSLSPCDLNIVTVTDDRNGILIQNLDAPREILKVFYSNYQLAYQCYGDCAESEEIRDLRFGKYYVNIISYDENWKFICEKNKTVTLSRYLQNRNTPFTSADFLLFPNPAEAETYIDISKLYGKKITMNLYNQFGQEVWSNHIEQIQQNRERIDLSNFQNGLYFLKIQTEYRRLVVKKLMVSRLY